MNRLASRYRPKSPGRSAADKAIEAAEQEERRAGKATVPVGDQRVRLRGIPVLVPPQHRRH